MGKEHMGADGIRSMGEYKHKYFPKKVKRDEEDALYDLPPEEFGRRLAEDYTNALRRIVHAFLRKDKRDKHANR